MRLKFTNFPLNLKSICHLVKQIRKNKSPLRIFHNFFLKDIIIKGKVIDLGSGNHSSYYNFINKDNTDIYYADKRKKKTKNFYQIDLEKKFTIPKNKFDTVILFNVIEHIENYKNLVSQISKIIKKRGRLELFVPFMFRYHEDPRDYFRPTHYYISKILEENGFTVKTYLIGVGPIKVVSEIILKYLKFNFFRVIFLIIFLIIDKIVNHFSKDYKNYYCGIHCTCIKKS